MVAVAVAGPAAAHTAYEVAVIVAVEAVAGLHSAAEEVGVSTYSLAVRNIRSLAKWETQDFCHNSLVAADTAAERSAVGIGEGLAPFGDWGRSDRPRHARGHGTERSRTC